MLKIILLRVLGMGGSCRVLARSKTSQILVNDVHSAQILMFNRIKKFTSLQIIWCFQAQNHKTPGQWTKLMRIF